ncbi:unnamed protein product [Ectocarpus fasciculatus]
MDRPLGPSLSRRERNSAFVITAPLSVFDSPLGWQFWRPSHLFIAYKKEATAFPFAPSAVLHPELRLPAAGYRTHPSEVRSMQLALLLTPHAVDTST